MTLLVGYIVCFSCGLVSSLCLLHRDITHRTSNETNQAMRVSRLWDRHQALAILFGSCQSGLFIADIVAAAIVLSNEDKSNWLDRAIMCTVQLLATTTVMSLTQKSSI
jgi:uncharacterized membrane protein